MNNNPSLNPADNGSLAGTLQFVFKKLLQSVDNLLPAKVIEYDRTNNRVSVQILISMITTSNTLVPRQQISSIPVLVMGGGGYFMSYPLNTGDLGWIAANDRDISLFLQSYNEAAPNTNRVKSFSDAVFIPDIMHGYTIDGADEDKLVIQDTDGNTKITLGDGEINLQSGDVNIMIDNSSAAINSPAISIDMGSPGNSINLNGGIIATGDVIAPNIP